MVGPVLYQEFMLGGRRNRQYVFRWIYAAWLVLQLLYLYLVDWWTAVMGAGWNITGAVGRDFVSLFVAQHFILLALATPVIVADAITDEKWRGTLQYLLTTDLQPWQILVGKLLGRLAQVVVLALTGLPLLCFIGVFGGLELSFLAGLMLTCVPLLLGLGAFSLLVAVWTTETRRAVLGIYLACGLVGFLNLNPGGILDYVGHLWWGKLLAPFSPLYVLEPAWHQPTWQGFLDILPRLGEATMAWGVFGACCLALASWRLRPAYTRQLESVGRQRGKQSWRTVRLAVDDRPIRWKERFVEGLAPLPFLRRIPTWLALVLVAVVSSGASIGLLRSQMPSSVTWSKLAGLVVHGQLAALMELIQPADDAFFGMGILAMLLLSLIVGIRCAGAISGEREKLAWEALLLSPLSVKELVRGKFWGILGAAWPYLLAYLIPAAAVSWLGGPVALFWTLVWGAVTWLAMYFVGAAGIWCSTRSKGSWRALLGTIGWAYVGGFVLFVVTSPVVSILAIFVLLILLLVDHLIGTGMGRSVATGFGTYFTAFFTSACLALALIFFLSARYFLGDAQKWVGERERTRHWKEDPLLRGKRRRPRGRDEGWEDGPRSRRGRWEDDYPEPLRRRSRHDDDED